MFYFIINEMKIKLKSPLFLIIIICILAMYITQCLPRKLYYYSKPMDELHFIYTVMKDDYKRSKTDKLKIKDLSLTCPSIKLNNEKKKILMDAILMINPNFDENELVSEIEFNISEKSFNDIMEKLDESLGNGTYYGSKWRTIYYNSYISQVFNTRIYKNISDIIICMEKYLIKVINNGTYNQYYLFKSKTNIISEKQISYMKDVLKEMQDNKAKDLTDNELYDIYNNLFLQINELLGENTPFGTKNRYIIFNNINTLQEQNNIFEMIKSEKITNTYARYYSDYLSILAGILPALFGAFILIDDRKYKMNQLVYSKKISSIEYVLIKFFSIVLLFMICFYIIAGFSTILFIKFSNEFKLTIDYFAFFKYTTFWIMPTIFFTISFTMLLSVIFVNGVISFIFQLILFLLSILDLIGNYSLWKPIIRFNEVGQLDFYNNNFHSIVVNRIFITILSFVLLVFTIKLYSMLRNDNNFLAQFYNKIKLYAKIGRKKVC